MSYKIARPSPIDGLMRMSVARIAAGYSTLEGSRGAQVLRGGFCLGAVEQMFDGDQSLADVSLEGAGVYLYSPRFDRPFLNISSTRCL